MKQPAPSAVVVLAAAAAASLLGEATRRFGVAIVVLEILLGVAIGPQGFALADPGQGAVPYLALYGMGFLFFMAGLEIDLGAIRAELGRAFAAWIAAAALAGLLALGMEAAGLFDSALVVAIALSTTALGILVPILKDAAVIDTPLGRHVVAAGVVGELAPIIAMSLALSTRYTTEVQAAFLAGFLLLVGLVYWASTHLFAPRVLAFLRGTMHRSGQLPVRIAVLLLVFLAFLAEELGVDLALGALAAGMIAGLVLHDASDRTMHRKIEAIAFGIFVPVFFIRSGMNLDVASIFETWHGMMRMAAALVSLVLLRLPGVLLYRGVLGPRQAIAHGLCSATTLSLVVAITGIAVAGGLMRPSEAAPLVGAAMLTVLVFPAVALAVAGLHRGQARDALDDLPYGF